MLLPTRIRQLPILILAVTQGAAFCLAQELEQPDDSSQRAIIWEDPQAYASYTDARLSELPYGTMDTLIVPVLPPSELSEWRIGAGEDIMEYADGATLASQSAVAGSIKTNDAAPKGNSMRGLFAVMSILGLLAGGMGCLQLARW